MGNQHTSGFSWMWDTNGAGNGSVVVGLLRMAQLILEMLMGLWCYLYWDAETVRGISNHSALLVVWFSFSVLVILLNVKDFEGLWSSWEADGAGAEQVWLPRE